MSGEKQVIRRLPSSTIADFDERMWPINLVLVAMAGSLAWFIVTHSDFRTAIAWKNGYFQLAGLAAIIAALALSLVWLKGRMQRRMQLGVFTSLLFHIYLCLTCYHLSMQAGAASDLTALREQALEEERNEERLVTLPDYHWQESADSPELTELTPMEELERPVETDSNDPVTEPVERKETRTTLVETPATAKVEPRESQEPSPSDLDRAQVSAPRRSEQTAGLTISRQELQNHRPFANVPIAPVESPTRPEQPSLDAAATAVARQEATEATRRSSEPERPQVRAETQLERNEATPSERPQQPRMAEAPAGRRTPANPQLTDAPRIAVAEPLQATPAREPARGPEAVTIERRDLSAPATRGDQGPAGPARAAPQPSVAAAPGSRAEPQAQIEPQSAAPPARASIAANFASTRVPESPLAAPSPPASATLEPSRVSPSRSEATAAISGSVSTATAQQSVEIARGGGPSPVMIDRAASRVASAGLDVGAPSASMARAERSASIAAAAEGAGTAARSAGPVSEARSLEPARTGLSRAAGGAVGVTRQESFDTGLPSSQTTSVQTAGAAQRAAASQRIEPGSAANPSEPAAIARSRAGASLPSSTLAADETVSVPDSTGSRRPSSVEANASAAIARSAARAPSGRVTASAGAADLDLGPREITSRGGEGRTSGGGEPTLGAGVIGSPVARSTGAAADLANVGGEQIDAPVSSPAGGAAGSSPVQPEAAQTGSSRSAPAGVGVGLQATANVGSGEAGAGRSIAAGIGSPQRRAGSNSEVVAGTPGDSSGGGTVGQSRTLSTASSIPTSSVEVAEPPSPSETRGGSSGGSTVAEPELANSGVERRAAGLAPNAGQSPGSAESVGGSSALQPPLVGPARRGESAAESGVLTGGESAAGEGTAHSRSTRPGVTGDAAIPIDVPAIGASSGGSTVSSTAGEIGATDSAGAVTRHSGAIPVRTAAPSGTGGLSFDRSSEIGLPSRRARPESDVAHAVASRLILERSGGLSSAAARVADVAVPGFQQRDSQNREKIAARRGGSQGTERAVELGLDFLARHQEPGGGWSLHNFAAGRPGYQDAGAGQIHSDTAATGLALIAFLGAGYTHTDGKYRLVVARGLDWLLQNQKADGDLFRGEDADSNKNVWLYSHGIAAISLCEAYGMTRDAVLKDPAQRSLNFIVAAQNPNEGGWRYSPRVGSDTSVSGWQLMAMKSGELAGLRVPPQTYELVARFLDSAEGVAKDSSRYAYRPRPTESDRDDQRKPSLTMTAEALLMRQYLGWKRDNPSLVEGADYLRSNLPEFGTRRDPKRNAYYWYYGTQVMFQMQGPHWDEWNGRLRPLLVESQQQDGPLSGSWDPLGPIADAWGPHAGRIYVTAMHLLMLEVYYRHLPLYQNLEQ